MPSLVTAWQAHSTNIPNTRNRIAWARPPALPADREARRWPPWRGSVPSHPPCARQRVRPSSPVAPDPCRRRRLPPCAIPLAASGIGHHPSPEKSAGPAAPPAFPGENALPNYADPPVAGKFPLPPAGQTTTGLPDLPQAAREYRDRQFRQKVHRVLRPCPNPTTADSSDRRCARRAPRRHRPALLRCVRGVPAFLPG